MLAAESAVLLGFKELYGRSSYFALITLFSVMCYNSQVVSEVVLYIYIYIYIYEDEVRERGRI